MLKRSGTIKNALAFLARSNVGVSLAIVIAAALWLYQTQSNGDEAPKRHPASHVIRVTAKLTFDGKPVEINDLVDCKTTYTGTPTSTPHMTFTMDRTEIATETPDGGMVSVRLSRNFCNVFGDTWGSRFAEFTPPEGWAPVIEWYDHRDPRQAETGIIYLSETALIAENNRLKIIEPFRIAIPEYPASDSLISESERQAEERDFWLGKAFSISEESKLLYGRMEWMLRIPESDWRNPERARQSFDVGRGKRSASPDFEALAIFLDGIENEHGVVVLGYADDLGSRDASMVFYGLLDGRQSGLGEFYERGIPMRRAARHGLLISDETLERHRKDPLYPDFVDGFVPFTCIDGVMTPMPETPGLIYWFRDRCSHPDYFRGLDFFGKPIAGDIMPPNGKVVFDPETGDLWRLDSN